MKSIILFLILPLFLRFNTKTEKHQEIPVVNTSISCINLAYIKGQIIISSDTAYQRFLTESSAASLMGNDCVGYTAPKINFNVYHLLITHAECGGCENPDIIKHFSYNSETGNYEYDLTLIQKGICKMLNHYYEAVLIKKTDIDISKLIFTTKNILPPRENR